MIIYIPSKGRVEHQGTWDNLPEALQAKTQIVCPVEEAEEHRKRGRNVLERPPFKLSAVRQWLADNCPERTMIMLDDDLGFFVRKHPAAYNLKPANPCETIKLLSRLHNYVDSGQYAHAGLSPRQMNNQHFPDTIKEVTRVNAVHCVDVDVLAKEYISYDDVTLMEDYHVTLSLLEKGYKNVQIVDGAWDQTRGSNASGGFSSVRTPELQEAAANRLAELHPDFVKVVEKTPKGGWGNGLTTRKDVRIQWKKAYGSSLRVN